MGRVLETFREIHVRSPMPALTLVPIDNDARAFYEGIGFVQFQASAVGGPMLLPASDIMSEA
jgi:hypothetical protein